MSKFHHSKLSPLKSLWKPGFNALVEARLPQSRKKRRILGLLAVAVFALGIYFIFFRAQSTEAAWYDESWAYRKAINIATHTASENNVYINLTGADDIDTSDTGRFQTDCGDLRFTDAAGNLLEYYIVSGCGSADTVVHVFFQAMPAGAQTVYVYYGNPSAQNGGSAADFATEASNYTFTTIGSEEKTPGPLVYWKFDDGTGTNTQDSTTNNLDGTITGPTWQTEDQCISGKCLWFDGSNDYVYAADNAILDNASSALTVGAWIKPNSYDASNWDIIATKWKDGAPNSYSWHFSLHQGKLSIFISSDGTTAGSELAVDSSVIETNKWSYVVFTVDTATDEVKLYKNGVQVGSTGSYTAASIPNSSAQLRIGTKEGANEGSFPFPGFIDDVKIYPYARTASQVLADYNSRGSVKGSSVSFGSSVSSGSSLSNGLVGYWKMDESSGNRSDSSGNGNTLTDNATVTSNPGKFGNAGQFTRTNTEYLSITDNASLSTGDIDFTFSAWVYADTTGGAGVFNNVAGKDGNTNQREWVLYTGSANPVLRFAVSPDGTSSSNGIATSTTTLSTSTWYFVVAWHDSVSNTVNIQVNNGTVDSTSYSSGTADRTGDFQIGANIGGQAWDGRIDEARFYKRVLSGAERTALYNFAPGPVGYWNMDENQGTSVNDSSGNALTGTITSATWTPGKYGSGLNFSGSTQYVTVSDNALLKPNTISVQTWFNTTNKDAQQNILSKTSAGSYNLWFNNTGSTTGCVTGTLCFIVHNGTTYVGAGYATSNLSNNTWYHVAGTFDGSTVRLYVNGVQVASTPFSGTFTHSTAPVCIGSEPSPTVCTDGFYFNGKIDDVRIYNYARTAKQIVEDLNAGHPAVGSPVGSAIGHWKFDEGVDNVCSGGTNDTCNSGSGGSTLDGAGSGFSSPATSTSGWTNSGKFGKALIFDGTDDYVSVADNTAIDIGQGTSSSISLWYYDTASDTNPHTLIAKRSADISSSTDYSLFTEVGLLIWGTGTSADSCAWMTTAIPSRNTWHHVVGVISSTGAQTGTKQLYVDGVQVSSCSYTNKTAANDHSMYIGKSDGSTGYWKGTIDEPKIYRYALTVDELKVDMNRSSSQVLGSISDKSTPGSNFAAGQEYCIPGDSSSCAAPVGEWRFDEKQGSSARDTSGNNFTGTLTSSPKWTSGKIGSGVIVNSTDQSYITMGNINKAIRTLSVWFKPNSTVNASSAGGMNNFIVFVDGSGHNADIWLTGGPATGACTDEVMGIMDTLNNYRTCSSNTTSISPVWNHFVMVWNTSTSNYDFYLNGQLQTVTKGIATAHVGLITASAFKIAQRGALPEFADTWGDFAIDQLRIYDYARSAAQIAWDYNRGAPVGHWKFDECQGTTAYDDSRNGSGTTNGNNGTITVGALGTQTAVGTCTGSANTMWKDGATGKYNASLDFDGTDDYVNVPSSTTLTISNDFTYSTWVKSTTTTPDYQNLFEYNNGSNIGVHAYLTGVNNANRGPLKVFVNFVDTSGNNHQYVTTNSNVWTADNWYHIVVIRNGANAEIYINGISQAISLDSTVGNTALTSSTVLQTTYDLQFGLRKSNSTLPLSGQLDDVQIYNYALTPVQVKGLYNNGAVRFGPSSGTP